MEEQERWYRANIELREQVVADVGANVGRLSQFFWEHGEGTTRVVSIEPVAENVEAIEERIRKADAADTWSVQRCAVSSHDGHLRMRTFSLSWGTNSVVDDTGEQVPCKKLSTLVPDATIVKVDVEGHEYAFLPGALDELPHVRVWAVELHHQEAHPLEDTLRLFVDHGYEVFAAGRKRADPDGPWVSAPVSAKLSWKQIPGTPTLRDGIPGELKMLHILAMKPT